MLAFLNDIVFVSLHIVSISCHFIFVPAFSQINITLLSLSLRICAE